MKQLPASIFRRFYHAKRACSFLCRYLTCLQLQQKDLLILLNPPHPPLHPGDKDHCECHARGHQERPRCALPCAWPGESRAEKVSGNPCMQHSSSPAGFLQRSELPEPLRAQSSELTAAAGQKPGSSVPIYLCPLPCAHVPVTEGKALSRQWHSQAVERGSPKLEVCTAERATGGANPRADTVPWWAPAAARAARQERKLPVPSMPPVLEKHSWAGRAAARAPAAPSAVPALQTGLQEPLGCCGMQEPSPDSPAAPSFPAACWKRLCPPCWAAEQGCLSLAVAVAACSSSCHFHVPARAREEHEQCLRALPASATLALVRASNGDTVITHGLKAHSRH